MARKAILFMVDFDVTETAVDPVDKKKRVTQTQLKRILVAAPSVVSAMDHVRLYYNVSYDAIRQVIRQDEIQLSDEVGRQFTKIKAK